MTQSLTANTKNTRQFIDDFTEFTRQSMEWCAKESENAAKTVGRILDLLMEDAKRISRMSDETMALLQTLRANTASLRAEGRTSEVIQSLKLLCQQHKDAADFIFPIVEALQFQDRITQMMANQMRMLATWTKVRTELATDRELQDEERLSFGKKLLECTTMKDERDIIRSVIAGLPAETVVENVMMF